jgi:hypothetical protein
MKRARIKAMLEAARSGQEAPLTFLERLDRGPLGMLLGYRVRFVAGALLLAGCAMWMHSNGLIPGQELKQLAAVASQPINRENLEASGATQAARELAGSWLEHYAAAQPLKLPLVGTWFNSFNPGLAGLLLVFSSFIPGLRIGLLMIPAAAILLFGPALGLGGWLSLAIGGGLGGAGLFFVR